MLCVLASGLLTKLRLKEVSMHSRISHYTNDKQFKLLKGQTAAIQG
jgi:hypothetical protein